MRQVELPFILNSRLPLCPGGIYPMVSFQLYSSFCIPILVNFGVSLNINCCCLNVFTRRFYVPFKVYQFAALLLLSLAYWVLIL